LGVGPAVGAVGEAAFTGAAKADGFTLRLVTNERDAVDGAAFVVVGAREARERAHGGLDAPAAQR